MQRLLALICLLYLTPDILLAEICLDCIFISSERGNDVQSCLQGENSSYTPCQTLSYVFSDSNFSLNHKEVILQGSHWLKQTLTVSGVKGLTIRGDGNTASLIKCNHAVNMEYGLVFQFVSNLTISNVNFEGCGTLQYSTTIRNYASVKYYSAVYIINSTDIQFSHTNFHRNIGRGISLHDVDGVVKVSNSDFKENILFPSSERGVFFGGGSIYIEFTYCSPGYSRCDPEANDHNKHSRYYITNCTFEANQAKNQEATNQSHIVQFRILPGSDGNNAGQGGGLHVIIKGSSFNNSVTVSNCRFFNNSAVWGGGIDTLFLDSASNNSFSVRHCIFESNSAPERGGGALHLGFYGVEKVTHNSITVEATRFINNSAGWGGAVAFFSSRSQSDLNTSLTFVDCVFEGNSASIGAAVHLHPEALQSIHDGSAPSAHFINSTFIKNEVLNSGIFLNIANDGMSHHMLESGIVDMESLKTDFSVYALFYGNRGSAIVSNSGQVNMLENAEVVFVNNTATNGGAIALLGFSVLELHPGSHIKFYSNNASELGGAVYATSPHQSEFVFSHKCFISFKGMHSNDPDKWNTTLTFVNNNAKYGLAIFADSVLPCVKQIGGIYTNITAAFQWNSFKISPENKQYTIATSPTSIKFSLPPEVSPGESIYLNLTSLDDLDQPIPSSFKVTLNSAGGVATTNSFVSEDGHLQIKGDPNTDFNLTLLTQNTRLVSTTNQGRLGKCPLGFELEKDTCVCSTGTQVELVGVLGCDMENFRALLQVGYWIGCLESKTLTGLCPLSYCNYEGSSATGLWVIPRTCEDLVHSSVCGEHRRGQLCGECEKGYSAYFHSEKFSCGECSYGALGLLIYIVAELLPLILVFISVMTFKLNITSGLMQSFLLFSQTLFVLNSVPSLVPLSKVTLTFMSVHTLIVGFFNMYFFHMDEMSFCLWRGATILDTIAIRYVTTLLTILLLTLFILAANKGVAYIKPFVNKYTSFMKFNCITKTIKVRKNSVIHGISAFLILSYTQYTLTSLQILSQVPIYKEGGKVYQSVVYLQGNLVFFGIDHLPYAVPAVLVLIFLSFPTPLLLIAYPSLWKIKAKIRLNIGSGNDTTIWPIRKLLPLIDSFQGVFKDNYRMFAGLLFMWRFILLAISAFASTLTEFFLLTEMALLIIFAIHTVFKPYRRRIYNITDEIMLFNMALTTLLKWYTSVPSTGRTSQETIDFVIFLQLLLMYIPLIGFGGYGVYRLLGWCNVIPEKFNCSLFREDNQNNNDSVVHKGVKKRSLKEKAAEHDDEDFFSRAAEINKLSSSVTCSEVGIEIATDKTTSTTLSTN